MSSGFTLERSNAPLMAIPPSSAAVNALNVPFNFPKGVRAPSIITALFTEKFLLLPSKLLSNRFQLLVKNSFAQIFRLNARSTTRQKNRTQPGESYLSQLLIYYLIILKI